VDDAEPEAGAQALPTLERQSEARPEKGLRVNKRRCGRNTGPMREISETINMSRLPSSSTESSDVQRHDAALRVNLQGAIRQRGACCRQTGLKPVLEEAR
jgi:hypothetical protein